MLRMRSPAKTKGRVLTYGAITAPIAAAPMTSTIRNRDSIGAT